MPSYKYTATTLDGKTVRGEKDAAGIPQLKNALAQENLFLIDQKEFLRSVKSKKMSYMDISDFCRQMSSMLSAGITMVNALNILLQREMPPAVRTVVEVLFKQVKTGMPMSEAMRYTKGAFPPLLISMVEAGEASGTTESVFMKMAVHYENENRTRKNIQGAMTYPIILFCLMVVAIIAIFTFILPKFINAFGDVELPKITQIVVAISDFLVAKWPVLLIVVVTVVAFFRLLYTQEFFRIFCSKTLLHAGKVGKLFSIIYTARFCRTFSSLYSSGLSIINACQISRTTIGAPYIESQFDEVVKEIRRGNTISNSISLVDGFDVKLKSTILIGEESGRLEHMLDSTASAYEYESEQSIKKLTSMIEPIMICVMGGAVALIFVAVMMPIYSLYDSVG